MASNVTQVVNQLLTLSEDPIKRPFIAKDKTCLNSVLRFIENNDSIIVDTALKILLNISSEESVKSILYGDAALLGCIRKMLASTTASPDQKSTCAQIFKNIHPSDKISSGVDASDSTIGPASNAPGSSGSNSVSNNRSARNKRSSITEQVKRKHKIIRLVISGISGHQKSQDRQLVENSLIKTKGVISFTYDLTKPHILVRCIETVTAADLKLNLLSPTTSYETPILVQQVVKDASKCDLIIEINASVAAGATAQHVDVPIGGTKDTDGYLEDDDSAVSNNANEHIFSGSSLVKLNDDKKNAGGWIGKASSFLAKSLYW